MSSYLQPSITVAVDVTNPGQFFACCGLLELADRLWPGARGWFERREFCILTDDESRHLNNLLDAARNMWFDVGDDTEDEDEDDGKPQVEPILLYWSEDDMKEEKRPAIQLDWWSDRSIKPWAGSMKERVILRAMLTAIDPQHGDPFNDLRRVQYQPPKLTKSGKRKKPQKKEPFYFDPRRGNKAHPLDCGFSPDTHNMEADCCPAVEALCFIGLQRARPASTSRANRSRYTVWPRLSPVDPGLPVSIVGPVVSGIVRVADSTTYVFDNYFRTDQRKHKTFSQAILERSAHD